MKVGDGKKLEKFEKSDWEEIETFVNIAIGLNSIVSKKGQNLGPFFD